MSAVIIAVINGIKLLQYGTITHCVNYSFQKHQYADVEVFETPGKGFGLRTLQDVEPYVLLLLLLLPHPHLFTNVPSC